MTKDSTFRAFLVGIFMLLLSVCAGCQAETVDAGPRIESAVVDSLTWVDDVDAERDTSGTSTGYVARLTVADQSPLTADELAEVLTVMRQSTPDDTAYLSVIAHAGPVDARKPVDVTSAADELGLRYTGFFTGISVSTSTVDDVLG